MTTENEESSLRTLACGVVVTPAPSEKCQSIWQALLQRQVHVRDGFAREGWSYLIFEVRRTPAPPLSERDRRILELTLLGTSRKVIAFDHELSPSTLGQLLKTSLARIGLPCLPLRVPAALVMLVHAAHAGSRTTNMFVGAFEHATARYLVVEHRSDYSLLARLRPSEREVISSIVKGESYVDIATQRNTSLRTVANQVASACGELGVSGRLELLRAIAQSSIIGGGDGTDGPAPTSAATSPATLRRRSADRLRGYSGSSPNSKPTRSGTASNGVAGTVSPRFAWSATE